MIVKGDNVMTIDKSGNIASDKVECILKTNFPEKITSLVTLIGGLERYT